MTPHFVHFNWCQLVFLMVSPGVSAVAVNGLNGHDTVVTLEGSLGNVANMQCMQNDAHLNMPFSSAVRHRFSQMGLVLRAVQGCLASMQRLLGRVLRRSAPSLSEAFGFI